MTRTYRRDLTETRRRLATIDEIVQKVRLSPVHQRAAMQARTELHAQLTPRRVNR